MPRRKLTDEQVAAIRNRRAAGETLEQVARDYGVHHTTVRNAVLRGYRGYRNQWGWYESGQSTVSASVAGR